MYQSNGMRVTSMCMSNSTSLHQHIGVRQSAAVDLIMPDALMAGFDVG